MKAEAVIFDLDGVLVDSEPYWREGFRAAIAVIAADVGVPVPPMSDEELHRYEGGRVPDTVRTLSAAMFGGQVPDTTIDRAVDAAVARASDLFAEDPRAITASVEAAGELHRRGVRIAVASSSAPVFIETVVARLGLVDAVEATASAFYLANPKPHPEVYLNVLREMELAPDACTAIEDSWTGVQAALMAGVRTVWLTAEPTESLKARVDALWDRDPESSARPRPTLMFTRALDADAVQELLEARP